MFDTEIAINAGGYSADSLAEDMDMLTRMIGYCCDFDKPYRVIRIAFLERIQSTSVLMK